MRTFTMEKLAAIIEDRAGQAMNSSYTASLLEKGTAHCARKFGEEAVEAIVAATSGDKPELASEAADVIYHLLVLLKSGDVSLDVVMTELESRTAQSGHAEKASRQGLSGR